jgi:hypothetical protein
VHVTADVRRVGAMVLWLGVLVACGGHSTLLPERGGDPPEVREACNRAQLRCSSCHTLDRIFSYQRRGRDDWQQEVKRMRLKPASGITVADAELIVTCLMYIDTVRPTAARPATDRLAIE